MNTHRDWKNTRVLITGGTSGLGRALALQALERGARVAIVARNQNKLQALVQEYPQLIAIAGDVSVKTAIHPIAAEVHSRLGDVDLLMNVASSLGPTPLRQLMDTECEDLEQVLQTNLIGPFRLTKALAPAMLLRQQGVVVNISSDAAVNAYATWGSYSVSKAGLDHLTRIFDEELKHQGVRFLTIDPGDMDTPMHAAAIPDADPASLKDPAESARQILELLTTQDFSQIRRSL